MFKYTSIITAALIISTPLGLHATTFINNSNQAVIISNFTWINSYDIAALPVTIEPHKSHEILYGPQSFDILTPRGTTLIATVKDLVESTQETVVTLQPDLSYTVEYIDQPADTQPNTKTCTLQKNPQGWYFMKLGKQ